MPFDAESVLRLWDAAMVARGKIDVPQTFEESILYDAATQVVWRAQKLLKAHRMRPPAILLEPGQSMAQAMDFDEP